MLEKNDQSGIEPIPSHGENHLNYQNPSRASRASIYSSLYVGRLHLYEDLYDLRESQCVQLVFRSTYGCLSDAIVDQKRQTRTCVSMHECFKRTLKSLAGR